VRGRYLIHYEGNNLHLLYGDLKNPATYTALPDIDVAYFLVHSMGYAASGGLKEEEEVITRQFTEGVKQKNVKQVIYLGGIANEKVLSEHLKSREAVESILKNSGIPYTFLRASIVVGSGSASFEIIRDLVEKLPFMVAPKWINTKCQPIAIRDVLFYLIKVILNEKCLNQAFEIGGPDVLTFKEMLLEYAEVRKLNRKIITVPVLTPHLSSYWLVFITSVKFSLAYYLVQSMKTNTIVKDPKILSLLPHDLINYRDAIKLALLRIEQNEVTSSWRDAWNINMDDPDVQRIMEVPKEGVLSNVHKEPLVISTDQVIDNIWSIGGKKGWYSLNWAWNLRGLIDKFAGGFGRSSYRMHFDRLEVGDLIDFWRVLKADKSSGHLILYAEMKLPGEAWLEFKIQNNELIQTATFRPKGLLGRLYWYGLSPFHYFIFRNMAKRIAQNKP
jgi:uncharacterized protein YbjT (DUF2867 family)